MTAISIAAAIGIATLGVTVRNAGLGVQKLCIFREVERSLINCKLRPAWRLLLWWFGLAAVMGGQGVIVTARGVGVREALVAEGIADLLVTCYLAKRLLHERVTCLQWASILTILAGTTLSTWSLEHEIVAEIPSSGAKAFKELNYTIVALSINLTLITVAACFLGVVRRLLRRHTFSPLLSSPRFTVFNDGFLEKLVSVMDVDSRTAAGVGSGGVTRTRRQRRSSHVSEKTLFSTSVSIEELDKEAVISELSGDSALMLGDARPFRREPSLLLLFFGRVSFFILLGAMKALLLFFFVPFCSAVARMQDIEFIVIYLFGCCASYAFLADGLSYMDMTYHVPLSAAFSSVLAIIYSGLLTAGGRRKWLVIEDENTFRQPFTNLVLLSMGVMGMIFNDLLILRREKMEAAMQQEEFLSTMRMSMETEFVEENYFSTGFKIRR